MSAETDKGQTWTSGDAPTPTPTPPDLDAATRKKNIAAFLASAASPPMLAHCAGALAPDLVATIARGLARQACGSDATEFLDAVPDEVILGMLSMSSNPLVAGLGQGALNARMVRMGNMLEAPTKSNDAKATKTP